MKYYLDVKYSPLQSRVSSKFLNPKASYHTAFVLDLFPAKYFWGWGLSKIFVKSTKGFFLFIFSHRGHRVLIKFCLSLKINRAHLGRYWDKKKYPAEKYPQLLRLIEKFELCFNIVGTDDYIIPELLPSQRPAIDMEAYRSTHNLHLHYSYDFMPAGIGELDIKIEGETGHAVSIIEAIKS